MGGGIGLMIGASHRVVTEKSRLAMPEITIGLFPDVGGTWFLNRLPAGWGNFLAMTGARLNALDCLELGIAEACLPSTAKEELLDTLRKQEWSEDKNSQVTSVLKKLAIKPEGLTPEGKSVRQLDQLIARFAQVSSVAEFKEVAHKLEEENPWIQSSLKSFFKGSPSSAAIILEQLKRGRDLSLEDVFRTELNLAVQCTIHPDFAEGVRALLVDKDQNPQWTPATHQDLSQEWIDSYFVPLWTEQSHPLKNLHSQFTENR